MTRLTDLLGFDLPVIQAPMAGVQLSRLTIAVSEAGGLGSLPCAMLGLEGLRAELQALSAGTRRPYNVNFFCHAPPARDPEREARWRATLAPYYSELGLDPATIPADSVRSPFTREAADVIEPFRPAVMSFHFGLPPADLVARVKAWGAKVISSATTVEEARWLEARGVDAVIAQGLQAGGHRGIFLSQDLGSQRPTLDLLRDVVASVTVPVIAAGGIASAADVASALALGASGVQVGSAYLLCPEANPSPLHRQALARDSRQTAVTNLFTGRPARAIVNRLMTELGPLSNAPPPFPLATAAITPLRARAEASGSADFSPLWCGDRPGPYRQLSAAALTRELASGAQGT
jgi:nitronate monooxygenase